MLQEPLLFLRVTGKIGISLEKVTVNISEGRSVLFAAESWDRRENNLKKRGHLLTAAELKRRGITRYDAEMLLSQGFSLPEPKTFVRSPASRKSLLKSSMPLRFSPRTHNKILPPCGSTATPTSTSIFPKSAMKRSVFIRPNQNRRVNRSLRSRTASRQLRFRNDRRLQKSFEARIGVTTRQVAKLTAKDTSMDRMDFGDDRVDNISGPESSGSAGDGSGQKVGVGLGLSMSCDAIDTDSSPWNPLKVIHCD